MLLRNASCIAIGCVSVLGCDGDDTARGPDATACHFEVSHELSTAVPTVAVVKWSANLEGVESATVEFGLDTNYGSTAAVDLESPERRTLLLGLKPSREYHFRVLTETGTSSCASEDYTLTTGDVANELALPSVEPIATGEITPGFLLLAHYANAGPTGGGPVMLGGGAAGAPGGDMFGEGGATWHAMTPGGGGAPQGGPMIEPGEKGESWLYVLDHDADPVWWMQAPISEVSRLLMSDDGKHFYAMSLNVAGKMPGHLLKISVDGLEVESIELPNAHHDFTLTPDGGIVFIKKSEDGCDEIVKRSSDGSFTTIYRVADAFAGDLSRGTTEDRCHTNSIHYNAHDDSFTFSVLNMNCYVKVSAAGELEWVLGGDFSHFTGDGAEWDREHGHHWLGDDRLVLFSNGSPADDGSLALEVELDHDARVSTRVFRYEGGESSAVLGDVQRLPNGNTLVAYSTAGVIHEVDPTGALVREIRWPLGSVFGYVHHRGSLYDARQR